MYTQDSKQFWEATQIASENCNACVLYGTHRNMKRISEPFELPRSKTCPLKMFSYLKKWSRLSLSCYNYLRINQIQCKCISSSGEWFNKPRHIHSQRPPTTLCLTSLQKLYRDSIVSERFMPHLILIMDTINSISSKSFSCEFSRIHQVDFLWAHLRGTFIFCDCFAEHNENLDY